MRLSVLLPLLMSTSACVSGVAPSQSAATPPGAPGQRSERARVGAAEAVPLSQIGFARAPKVSDAARKRNAAAEQSYDIGDYLASRDGFQAAVRDSPDYDTARFNLVRALARTGELQAARDELQLLLRRDLLRFQPLWRGDVQEPDLEALRMSPLAQALDAQVAQLRVAYEAAHDQGVAAYLFEEDPRPQVTDFGGNVTEGASNLISGAWVHSAARFVPLAHGGTVALLDLPRRRVLRAVVSLEEQHCHYDVYATAVVSSTSSEPGKAAIGYARDVSEEPENEYAPPPQPELTLADEDDELLAITLIVTADGAFYTSRGPDGYVVVGNRLTVPGYDTAFQLDRDYETVFVPEEPGAPLFLLARRDEFVDLESELDTTVSRINLETGSVETLDHGVGDGWVSLGPNNDVYVEVDDRVRRWATPDAETSEPTIEGLHITMPYDGRSELCAG